MEQPLISIVIATYNRASSLRSYSLPAIAKLNYPNYEVVIVDDASTDDTQSFLNTSDENIKNLLVLRNNKNQGACFSRNIGVAHTKGKIVVLMDDDVSPFPDCLDEIIKVYTEDPDVMVIWGCIYEQGGSLAKGTATFGTGSLWSLRREVFEHFRFDTNLRYFRSTACDEHDLARRIQKHNFKIIKAKTVKADHFHAPAENRIWRGLGGDLNYLYEKLKYGSIFQYYGLFILGVLLLPNRLLKKGDMNKNLQNHPYYQVFETPNRFLVFIKQRQLFMAAKWLFYILIDIPFRAKTKGIFESLSKAYSAKWPA
jgi:glycosyltransferase involved in cell wall biosynthesis